MAMGSNSIFLGFTHDQIVESITSMQRVDFAPKQQIITRGNIGDKVRASRTLPRPRAVPPRAPRAPPPR
eukprot:5181734-Prymnesium_polylepis.2